MKNWKVVILLFAGVAFIYVGSVVGGLPLRKDFSDWHFWLMSIMVVIGITLCVLVGKLSKEEDNHGS